MHKLKLACLQGVPELKVFLDVDDLDDIKKLAEYVEASSCILLFISRGYFQSSNCLIEIEAALELRKPLILIYETSKMHGGCSIQDIIRSECPVHLQHRILELATTLLQYQRGKEFELVTVCEVLECALLATPKYASAPHEAVELYTKQSVLHRGMQLSRPVALFYSQYNARAAEVASQLAAYLGDRMVLTGVFEVPDAAAEVAAEASTRPPLKACGSSLARARSSSSFRHGLRESSSPSKERSIPKWSQPSDGSARHAALEKDTYFLLLLNELTFAEEPTVGLLTQQLSYLLDSGSRVLLVHDTTLPFDHFLRVTPKELLLRRIYQSLAVPLCASGMQRAVSFALLAQNIDAKPVGPIRQNWSDVAMISRPTMRGSTQEVLPDPEQIEGAAADISIEEGSYSGGSSSRRHSLDGLRSAVRSFAAADAVGEPSASQAVYTTAEDSHAGSGNLSSHVSRLSKGPKAVRATGGQDW